MGSPARWRRTARDCNGRPSATSRSLESAREKAREWRALIRKGRDPQLDTKALRSFSPPTSSMAPPVFVDIGFEAFGRAWLLPIFRNTGYRIGAQQKPVRRSDRLIVAPTMMGHEDL
ncbi:MAG: integrase arm-type DNA-binding domain-containing protein [Bradyrhizobium sp.]|nr:integrase arm-type DNA-binding domain-containing protein [Bradyrhizobium sp.]